MELLKFTIKLVQTCQRRFVKLINISVVVKHLAGSQFRNCESVMWRIKYAHNTLRTTENITAVAQSVEEYPGGSVEYGNTQTSLYRILLKDLGLQA